MKAKEGVNTKWANLVVCSAQGRNARWRERGWKTNRQTQEEINGRECHVHVRGMRLSGSRILPWTLGDYPTGHHMMDCGPRLFGRQRRTCQACQAERCCMLSLSISGWYVTSLGAARLFTSVLKNSQHSLIVDTKHLLFLVLCGDACLTHTQSISSQQSVLWKACVHHETMKRNKLI